MRKWESEEINGRTFWFARICLFMSMLKSFIALQLSRICGKKKFDCTGCSLLPLCKCEEGELERMARNEGKIWAVLFIASLLGVIYFISVF